MQAMDPVADGELERALAEFRGALRVVADAVQDNVTRGGRILRKIGEIEARLDAGMSLAEIVEVEERPLVVELLTDNISTLNRTGVTLRRTEVRALHAQGLTMQEIADHFGVTRQRVGRLLRGEPEVVTDQVGPNGA